MIVAPQPTGEKLWKKEHLACHGILVASTTGAPPTIRSSAVLTPQVWPGMETKSGSVWVVSASLLMPVDSVLMPVDSVVQSSVDSVLQSIDSVLIPVNSVVINSALTWVTRNKGHFPVIWDLSHLAGPARISWKNIKVYAPSGAYG